MGRQLIYLNGKLVRENAPHISALDRGFTLGDGVFDTMKAVGGRVFRLRDHLDRLEGSARTIGMRMPVEQEGLARAVADLLDANALADAIVRITVSRGVPVERGLLPLPSPSPTVVAVATPFRGYPRAWFERGFRVVISRIRRNESSPLSRIKSCNYMDSVLARMEASRGGAEEALLLNSSGELACGASSNLFLVLDGTLVTPALESGVLDGITRRTVLDLAAGLDIPYAQRRVRRSEIDTAEEVLVTNTAVGIMPVVGVDGHRVGDGSPGRVAARLREAYQEVL